MQIYSVTFPLDVWDLSVTQNVSIEKKIYIYFHQHIWYDNVHIVKFVLVFILCKITHFSYFFPKKHDLIGCGKEEAKALIYLDKVC